MAARQIINIFALIISLKVALSYRFDIFLIVPVSIGLLHFDVLVGVVMLLLVGLIIIIVVREFVTITCSFFKVVSQGILNNHILFLFALQVLRLKGTLDLGDIDVL